MKKIKQIGKCKEDMRGMFFILKGQYNAKQGMESLDPENENTEEWYEAMDNVVFNTIACGSSLDKCVRAVETCIKKHGTREEYFRTLSEFTTEDYYQVHYKGQAPFTTEQLHDMMGNGMRARTSPATKELMKEAYDRYGYEYEELIAEAEDRAYQSTRFSTPLQRTQKIALKRTEKTIQPRKDTKPISDNPKEEKTLKKTNKKPLRMKPKQLKKSTSQDA